MFHQLLNRNDDLRRLVEKGYAVAIDGGYLVVRDIPYLDAQRELQWGAFVAKLEFTNNLTVQQDDHQVWFAGSVPHGLDAKPIPNLGGGPTSLPLGRTAEMLSFNGVFPINRQPQADMPISLKRSRAI